MKRYALILASDQFQEGISSLQFAERDAWAFFGFLKDAAGFDRVDDLIGPSLVQADAEDRAEELAEELSRAGGGLLLVIYAGHGYTLHDRHGLLCHRARLRDIDEFRHVITVSKLEERTAKPGVSRQLVVDACRTNLRAGARAASEGYQASGLRNLVAASSVSHSTSGCSVLASCSGGEQAIELPKLKNGIFTWALLHELREAHRSGRELSFDDAFVALVRRRLESGCREHGLDQSQRPWVRSNAAPPAILLKRNLSYSLPIGFWACSPGEFSARATDVHLLRAGLPRGPQELAAAARLYQAFSHHGQWK